MLDALYDWNLDDKVQIMCCDTTASNTGRLNEACVFLEQKLGRELVLFGCRHHVYKLVLKCVFESKIPQVTNSPDIPMFKKFRDNWKTINPTAIEKYTDLVTEHFCYAVCKNKDISIQTLKKRPSKENILHNL